MSANPERTVTIHLMDCFTGHTAVTLWSAGWEASDFDHLLEYTWTEGNWSCDCNRWREWLAALGSPHASFGSEQEAAGSICGEPRIRAKYLGGTEPFDDWPESEADRLVMATRIRASREKMNN